MRRHDSVDITETATKPVIHKIQEAKRLCPRPNALKIMQQASAIPIKCGVRCGIGTVRLSKTDSIQRLATECGILSLRHIPSNQVIVAPIKRSKATTPPTFLMCCLGLLRCQHLFYERLYT